MQLRRIVSATTLAVFSLAVQAASPTHLYLLDDASDALGGPALTSLGGGFASAAFGASGYAFGANQGLSVAGAVNESVYTIDLSFAFDTLFGYRRLIDFKNLGSDTGLYNLSASLNFYNVATGPAVFTETALSRVTLTRDAGGWVVGYVDGVEQIAFQDSTNLGTFTGPDQIAHFFRDDQAVGGEASGGFVDYIRFYDSALSATEVAGLTNPVPEPGTWALMLGGLTALSWAVRRR